MNDVTPPPRANPHRWRSALPRLGWLALGAAVLAWMLRLTLRDSWAPLAPVYYAAQPVLLASAAAAVLALAAWTRRRWLAAAATLLLAVSAGSWLASNYRTARIAPASAESTRVLLWNITGRRFADDALARQIHAHAPDIVVLVEAYTNQASQDAARAAGFAVDYSPRTSSLLLLARGEIVESQSWISPGGARLKESRLRVGPRTLRVLSVDIPSNPFFSRRAAFEDILARIRADRSDEPTIILGDFNTPPDSVFFDPFRELARCAWESAGRGYRCTWPTGLPVLAIDQVWMTAGLTPTHCEMFTSLLSDHRMVVADFAWPANAP